MWEETVALSVTTGGWLSMGLYVGETKLMHFLTDQDRIPDPGNRLLLQLLEISTV